MPTPRNWLTDEDARNEADRQTAGLIGFAVVLLVLIAGLFLVHILYDKSKTEDCLMAGRINCDRMLVKR